MSAGWPLPRGTMCPKDWTPQMRDTGTYRAMEDLYEQGRPGPMPEYWKIRFHSPEVLDCIPEMEAILVSNVVH